MKKNLLAVLLPVVAGVALSGTGFGLWVFNENITSKTIGASMQLEPAFNITNSLKATLTVANVNDTSTTKIVFDEEDKGVSNPWKVTVKVEIVLEELFGKLMTANTGESITYTQDNVVNFTELQDKLATHKIKVTQTLNGITDYISVNAESIVETLDHFTTIVSSPMTQDLKQHTLSKDYVFIYNPKSLYNDIDSKGEYTNFRTALAAASLTYTVEFDPTTV
ncbi:MAG: hypothetical protein MR464_03205 [Bacilli bacterium]|nr:hypothetical protein [Bacilli bacterium]